MRRARSWIDVVATGILLVIFVLLFHSTIAWAQGDGLNQTAHACGENALTAGTGGTLSAALPGQRVVLTPAKELEMRIRFHRGRGYRTSQDLTLLYNDTTVPDPETFPYGSLTELTVAVFKRDDDALELNAAERVVYLAQSTPRGVNLRLCFNASGVPPGRYQSTVQLANESLQHTPIPLVITIQENNLWLMGGILLTAMGAGVFVLFFQNRLVTEAQGGRRQSFMEWFARAWFGLLLAIGAAWGAWYSQYLQNESFGGEGVQYLLLWVACAVAFVGAGVAGSLGYESVNKVQTVVSDSSTAGGRG